MNEADKLIPMREVRAYLGNPSKWFMRQVAETLPIVQLGPKRRMVRLGDLQAWIAANTTKAEGRTSKPGTDR